MNHQFGRAARVVAAVAVGLAAGFTLQPGAAHAGSLTFDFGSMVANGRSDAITGVLGTNAQSFTNQGVTLSADAYHLADTPGLAIGGWVTQKSGTFTGGEAGLGASSTAAGSDREWEIAKGTYLLLDNRAALSAGYAPTSISIGSLQAGETATISAYSGAFSTSGLDLSKLTVLATLTNPGSGGVVQSVNNLPADSFFVVTETGSGNVTVGAEILNRQTVAAPEPASMALLATGVLGLGLARRRRRT